LSSVP